MYKFRSLHSMFTCLRTCDNETTEPDVHYWNAASIFGDHCINSVPYSYLFLKFWNMITHSSVTFPLGSRVCGRGFGRTWYRGGIMFKETPFPVAFPSLQSVLFRSTIPWALNRVVWFVLLIFLSRSHRSKLAQRSFHKQEAVPVLYPFWNFAGHYPGARLTLPWPKQDQNQSPRPTKRSFELWNTEGWFHRTN